MQDMKHAVATGGYFGLRHKIGLALGPLWLVVVLAVPAPEGLSEPGWFAAGIALLMATWWISEAVPIPVTALLPLVLFPLFGVGTIRETSEPYANPLIFLFLGGFMIALAMERWGLHKRIALNIIKRVGTSPLGLVGGFMIASAFLSMWVSNTATTLMMLPVGLSVISVFDERVEGQDRARFSLLILLGIAYAANIGGMGTLIGTPPNAFLAGFIEEQFGLTITFSRWLLVGLPIVVVGLPLTYFALTRIIYPVSVREFPGSRTIIARELTAMGRMTLGERYVAWVFAVTALLWIARPLVARVIPGISDAGIAMAGGLVLFVLPIDFKRGIFAQNWETTKRLPWGTLILIGGGLSLAAAFTRTELSTWIGESLGILEFMPVILVLLAVTAVIVFLTELTSNVATTAAFLPALAALAVGIGQNPLLLAIPAVLGASCAFMLPVATPPNAIVYGSGRISVPQMARAGIVLNLLFMLLITTAGYILLQWAFSIEMGVIPDWAQ